MPEVVAGSRCIAFPHLAAKRFHPPFETLRILPIDANSIEFAHAIRGSGEHLAEGRASRMGSRAHRFAPVPYLADAVARIEAVPQSTFDEIVEKYVEVNVAHLFREGNGRAMRIWLDAMLKAELGKAVDCSLVGREDYLPAMERSTIRDTEIESLLKSALSEAADDREAFMKGIGASYAYEGYSSYKAADL